MISKPWHEQHPKEYERVRKSIEAEFPYLRFTSRAERTVLVGTLPIVEGRRVIDEWSVEITLPHAGPRAGIPTVREVAGRIPHILDRHVYPNSGNSCLAVPDEFWLRHPHGLELLDFLRGPVMSYFVSQTAFELGHGWPFDERSHGALGIMEFWAEVAGGKDIGKIRGYLDAIASHTYKPRWFCPCRSGRRVQNCHAEKIQTLRKRIPRELAARRRSLL